MQRQVSVPIYYEELKMEKGFIEDLIVNDKEIVELKSVEELKKCIANNLLHI